jgi:hypothetical protein
MSNFQNLSHSELLDLLIKYTNEYVQLPKEGPEFMLCKSNINEIVRELKVRKESDDFKNPVR